MFSKVLEAFESYLNNEEKAFSIVAITRFILKSTF